MVNASTRYYRLNRETKKVIHKCSHCDYETSNTRIQLLNHINAKHVAEEDRPYQCELCDRGFAQKAHLDNHSKVVHKITNIVNKVSSISYIISPTNILPKSTKTKARRVYYLTHGVINTTDINNKKHEYLPDVYLKKHDIHYDAEKGFIKLDKCQLYVNTCDCHYIMLPRRV